MTRSQRKEIFRLRQSIEGSKEQIRRIDCALAAAKEAHAQELKWSRTCYEREVEKCEARILDIECGVIQWGVGW